MGSIANTKSYKITHPETGEQASIIAVMPKGADLAEYLESAAKRFDWKAWADQKASVNKVRVGQQKQQKRK